MKATGIVRRIDDLGRVVIPKEIRRTLRIKEGDPLEIFTDREGEVIFKKYSPIGELGDFASDFAESIARAVQSAVCITDRDTIIAVSGAPKKELFERRISSGLEQIMDEKVAYSMKNPASAIKVTDSHDKYNIGVAMPIISEGDTIGSVVICADEKNNIGTSDLKVVQTAANFLGRHMEQ